MCNILSSLLGIDLSLGFMVGLNWIAWYSTQCAMIKVFFAGNFRRVLRWISALPEIIFRALRLCLKKKTGAHNWSGKPVEIF